MKIALQLKTRIPKYTNFQLIIMKITMNAEMLVTTQTHGGKLLKTYVEVLWVSTPCSFMAGHQLISVGF
jgi:hypothetical protein